MQRLAEKDVLKIGTRGSPLALYQARLVQSKLAAAMNVPPGDKDTQLPICIFKTSGDKLKGELAEFGGKGLFTKELEDALIGGEVDLAVHSMKDVPTQSQPELTIASVLEREDPRDAFISAEGTMLSDLPHGAVIGTASLRRRAQLWALRPDIEFVLLRGNVGTRLNKLRAGECQGTFLAYAGLKRLECADVATEIISADVMLNAPAQGAIGIEVRKGDTRVQERVLALDHQDTHLSIVAERAFLRALDGSCRTPIAALARTDGGDLHFRGQVLSLDGKYDVSRQTVVGIKDKDEAYAAGYTIGLDVRGEIGDRNIWET